VEKAAVLLIHCLLIRPPVTSTLAEPVGRPANPAGLFSSAVDISLAAGI
jgi:hypothetical protein